MKIREKREKRMKEVVQLKEPAVWERHKSYIEILPYINNSFVFVSQWQHKYVFVSSNFKEYFRKNVSCGDFTKGGIIERLIHPDDMLYLLDIQQKAFDYLFELPPEVWPHYKHTFEFRIMNPDRKYIRVIFQSRILEGSTKEHLLLLGIMDISPNQNIDEAPRSHLVNSKINQVVSFSLNGSTNNILTRRETEIIDMINNGLLSKEISDKLSISIYTVNRHRQNIMEKMRATNLAEAINCARKLGIIR